MGNNFIYSQDWRFNRCNLRIILWDILAGFFREKWIWNKKMKMLKSRKGIIWIPIIVIISIIVLLIILANVGKICLFSKCFYLISPQFSNELNFWILVTFWIILQVAFVYAFFKMGSLVRRAFKFIRGKFDIFIQYFKKIITS